MFFELVLDNIPGGFALDSVEAGQSVRIAYRQFLTTDDGEILYTFLDSIWSMFLSEELNKAGMRASQIDQCLITIEKDKTVKVYVNDFSTVLEIVGRGRVEVGQPITTEDIGDIRRVDFPTVGINQDIGIIYIFSYGWRKALYFDFTPVLPESTATLGDTGSLFAKFHSIMFFKELFHLKESTLSQMYDEGWFPFIRILGRMFGRLCADIENQFPSKPGEKAVIEHFGKDVLDEMLMSWEKRELFQPHIPLLRRGIERYFAGDYVSSISVLFPRIEGILRHVYLGKQGRATQNGLIDSLWEKVSEKHINTNLFLPDRFREYLKRFYFASFDLETGQFDVSRHTVAHGVARQEDFDQVRALQAILILDQLFYYV